MFRIIKSALTLLVLTTHILGAEWIIPEHSFSETMKIHNPKIAADARGNAIAVWEDIHQNSKHVIYGSHFNPETLLWSSPVLISDVSGSSDDAPHLTMTHYGKGFVVFRDNNVPMIQASVYQSGSWSMVEAFLDEGILSKPLIVHASEDISLIVWISSINGLQSVAYENGVFKEVKRIDPLMTEVGTGLTLAMSHNGKAVLFWLEQEIIYYRVWQGFEWSSVKNATHRVGSKAFDVGIDDHGDIFLVFQRDQAIHFKKFSEGAWSSALQLTSEKSQNYDPRLLVDPKGTAVAIWRRNGKTLESSHYDKKDWKRSEMISIEETSEIKLLNDGHENVLVIYTAINSGFHELKSIFFNPNLGWSQPELITSLSQPFNNIAVATSSLYHTAFSMWEGDGKAKGSFSIFALPSIPPSTFEARLKKDRFPSQTDRIHILKWNQTIDPTVIGYRIKQGNNVIFECSVNAAREIILHNRERKAATHYSICSINMLGNEGVPKKISIR